MKFRRMATAPAVAPTAITIMAPTATFTRTPTTPWAYMNLRVSMAGWTDLTGTMFWPKRLLTATILTPLLSVPPEVTLGMRTVSPTRWSTSGVEPHNQAVRRQKFTTTYGCLFSWLPLPPEAPMVIVWLWFPSVLVRPVGLFQSAPDEPAWFSAAS